MPCPGGVVSQTLKNETQLILHSNFFHFSKWSPLLLSLSCAHAKRQRKCRFIFYWSLLLKCRRVHRLYRLTVCVCVRVCAGAHNCAGLCRRHRQRRAAGSAQFAVSNREKKQIKSILCHCHRFVLYTYICTREHTKEKPHKKIQHLHLRPFPVSSALLLPHRMR